MVQLRGTRSNARTHTHTQARASTRPGCVRVCACVNSHMLLLSASRASGTDASSPPRSPPDSPPLPVAFVWRVLWVCVCMSVCVFGFQTNFLEFPRPCSASALTSLRQQ